jgi:type II secretory pathway pseudopilin PulG
MKSTAGFSLVEILVATLVIVVVLGAIAGLLSRAGDAIAAQPEVSDVQQRLRVGVAALQRDLLSAGAGAYIGPVPGGLSRYVAPVQPYRWGSNPAGAFRDDVITVICVPALPAQASVAKLRQNPGEDLELDLRTEDGAHTFTRRMRVMLVEPDGGWAFGVVTEVAPTMLRVRAATDVPPALDEGRSLVVEVTTHTYSLKPDPTTGAFQLVHYDGVETELPVIDRVVSLGFRYWVEHPATATLSEIAGSNLTDGPWLPDAVSPLRYDADLLRIRRIGVRLRVQAASPWLRATTIGSRAVRDGELTLDVSPPNMNFRW